jgi:hypothetical protein
MEMCEVLKQTSVTRCIQNSTFGCAASATDLPNQPSHPLFGPGPWLWVKAGCRGVFSCGSHPSLRCEGRFGVLKNAQRECNCDVPRRPEACELCTQLWRQPALAQPQLPPVTRAELVIASCAMSLPYVLDEIPRIERIGMRVARITIYVKCGRVVYANSTLTNWMHKRRRVSSGTAISVEALPNVGRCDHSFAHHMAERWDSLEPLTVFTKDRMDTPWSPGKNLAAGLAKTAARASTNGFACAFGPADPAVSMWHATSHVSAFQMGKYTPTRATSKQASALAARTANASGQSYAAQPTTFTAALRPLGTWLNQSDIFPAELIAELGARPLWPVCLNGMFAARRENVQRLTQGTWRALARGLARGDSIEEGHFTERMWAALLTPRLPEAVAERLICSAGGTYEGALAVCHCPEAANVAKSPGCGAAKRGMGHLLQRTHQYSPPQWTQQFQSVNEWF